MITIYTKPNCDFCRDAKLFLNSFDIPFKEIDISNNSVDEDFIKSKHDTVPQIYKDGELFVADGFVGLVTSDINRLKKDS